MNYSNSQMDIENLIRNINNLNDYVVATQDASEICKTSTIQLNMTTIIALKKIRSFEIEYVNKCEENGIACVIFERILCLPPSEDWGLLTKEMVNLLQYWLDAIRKHLVKHSAHWWIFLKLLLKFIKEINHKHKSVSNILVEYTSECLLDLATTERPDAMQRYEILHCFNLYCSESNREIRKAFKNQFGQYFTKLAQYMSSCGNLATQYSIMETLMRWLLPRHDRTLRIMSATKWFPARLYSDNTVDIFLNRPWMNFFKDARDFLNSHNETSDLITSVVCRKLSVGATVLISNPERNDSWLDINSATKCLSVLLDPLVLNVFGFANNKSFETFVLSEDITHTAKLIRKSGRIILCVQTVTPPRVLPSCFKLGDDVSCDVTLVITSHCNVKTLDVALRNIFDNKYQLLLNLEEETPLSPVKATKSNTITPDAVANLAHVPKEKPINNAGFVFMSSVASCRTPSSTSTTSLAQLQGNLAALPRYTFEKEAHSICALPDLSIVSEASELDERSSRPLNYESCTNFYRTQNKLDCNRKSQSDNETSRRYPEVSRKPKYRQLSPVIKENATSCLLVATVGSTDDAVIKETVDKLSSSKDFDPENIVNLLVQEALQDNLEKEKCDSGINTGEKRTQEVSDNCDAIENTLSGGITINNTEKKYPRTVSPTSDESNTEDVDDTNDYVNTSRRNKNQSKDVVERQSFDVQAVEEFFSQHFTENKQGQLVISPSLARNINETSSDSEARGDDINFIGDDLQDVVPCDFNNIEILECLNSIVDKVCDNLDKCTAAVDEDSDFEDNLPLKDILNTIQKIDPKNKEVVHKSTAKAIKLKYKIAPKKRKTSRKIKKTNKLEIETISKMSTILEVISPRSKTPVKTSENFEIQKKSIPDNNVECTTPPLRRKRKLFSPKDEVMNEGMNEETNLKDNECTDLNIAKTPKSVTTYKPYKEIEKERQMHTRMPRNRKSRKINSPSPRSKKMNDLFDKVKESANGEYVTLAKKQTNSDVYNFSTDSEDDFKITKKSSNTTVDTVESTVLSRGRVVKRIDYSSKNDSKDTKRKVNKRQRAKKEIHIELVNDLIDERMREHKDILNTSMVVETPIIIVAEPDLVLEKPPQMEVIDINEEQANEVPKRPKRTRNKNKAKTVESVKEVKKTLNIKLNSDNNRTESPLPGLVVEEAPTTVDQDADMSATMVAKFKKICRNPEKYINESNNTQNLLSDNDRNVYSPQNTEMITDDLMQVKSKSVKSKKKSSLKREKKNNKNIVKVSNIPMSATKSDKSISTDGITGHGDEEEAPPSPKLIVERLQHRNLTTEYLDRSTKDYFDKLTEEINDINDICRNYSNKNDASRSLNKSSHSDINVLDKKSSDSLKTIMSPSVSVKRLSLEDISRWLPSSRNSETDYSQSSMKSKHDIAKIADSPKMKRKRQNSKEVSTRSNKSTKNSNSSKSRNKTIDATNSIKSAQVIVKAKTQASSQIKCTPKSIISPIKLFEDLISNADKLSQTTLSDDEQYINDIKATFSKMEKFRTQSSTDDDPIIKTKTKNIKKVCDNRKAEQSVPVTRLVRSQSSRTKTSTRSLKRSLEEDRDGEKNDAADNNNIGDVISGSGVTVSSVGDWFKRIEPDGSRDEGRNLLIKDSIQNVIEKLDTTLVEIHQNTSNKFVHLFVSAQQQLSELKQERQNTYKLVASDILSGMIRLMDDKFADLDKKSQEQDRCFMKQLVEQASSVIREDCKKKRVMVQLLKEDVQAVLQHMARRSQ